MKRLLFLAAFLVFSFAQAQDYELMVMDNYLVMTSAVDGDEEVEIPLKDVRFRIKDGIIKFYDADTVRSLNGDPNGYDITTIETDGAILSEQDLRAFLKRETGFSSGNGGTAQSVTVNGADDVDATGIDDEDILVWNSATSTWEVSRQNPSEYGKIDITGNFNFFNFAVVDPLLEDKTLILLSDGLGSGTRTHTFGRFNDQQTATTTDGDNLLFGLGALGWNCLNCEEDVAQEINWATTNFYASETFDGRFSNPVSQDYTFTTPANGDGNYILRHSILTTNVNAWIRVGTTLGGTDVADTSSNTANRLTNTNLEYEQVIELEASTTYHVQLGGGGSAYVENASYEVRSVSFAQDRNHSELYTELTSDDWTNVNTVAVEDVIYDGQRAVALTDIRTGFVTNLVNTTNGNTLLDRYVKIELGIDAANVGSFLLRRLADSGIASDAVINLNDGDFHTNTVGSGIRPELIESTITEQTATYIIKFSPQIFESWILYPTAGVTNYATNGSFTTAQVGTATLLDVKLNYNYQEESQSLFQNTLDAGTYDFTTFPAPTTGNNFIDSTPTDISAGTKFIANGTGTVTTFNGSYSFSEGDIITVIEDAPNFASTTLSVNDNSLRTSLPKECYTTDNISESYQTTTSGASSQAASLENLGTITVLGGDYEIVHTGVLNTVSAGVTITTIDTHVSANNAASDSSVFTTSGNRITPGVPSKTYTVTLAAGTYTVYAWNGNNTTVQHDISIKSANQFYVSTLADNTQYAFNQDNVEVDISGGLPSDWIACVTPTTATASTQPQNQLLATGQWIQNGNNVPLASANWVQLTDSDLRGLTPLSLTGDTIEIQIDEAGVYDVSSSMWCQAAVDDTFTSVIVEKISPLFGVGYRAAAASFLSKGTGFQAPVTATGIEIDMAVGDIFRVTYTNVSVLDGFSETLKVRRVR